MSPRNSALLYLQDMAINSELHILRNRRETSKVEEGYQGNAGGEDKGRDWGIKLIILC